MKFFKKYSFTLKQDKKYRMENRKQMIYLNPTISLILLQKPVLEKANTTLGELEKSGFITLAGLEQLTRQVLSPEQRGYRVFILRQAWLNGFAGLQGQGDCKEQDKGEWDKLQLLVLWVPTSWDLRDPDFAGSKLSYRGREAGGYVKF